MGVDYIPRRDVEFAAWLKVLLAGVQDVEAKLDEQRRAPLAALAPVVREFLHDLEGHDQAQKLAHGARHLKDQTRQRCERAVRQIVRHLQNTEAITDADRATLAIRVPKRIRLAQATAAQPPRTVPVLSVESRGATHVLCWFDENTPRRRAKPPRVGSCAIERAVLPATADAPLSDDQAWIMIGMFTAMPKLLQYPTQQAGWRAFYRGRWANTRNICGRWGNTVSALIGD